MYAFVSDVHSISLPLSIRYICVCDCVVCLSFLQFAFVGNYARMYSCVKGESVDMSSIYIVSVHESGVSTG